MLILPSTFSKQIGPNWFMSLESFSLVISSLKARHQDLGITFLSKCKIKQFQRGMKHLVMCRWCHGNSNLIFLLLFWMTSIHLIWYFNLCYTWTNWKWLVMYIYIPIYEFILGWFLIPFWSSSILSTVYLVERDLTWSGLHKKDSLPIHCSCIPKDCQCCQQIIQTYL